MRANQALVGIALLLCACTSEITELGKVPDYFSMDSLIEVQVEKLIALNPELIKSGTLDGKKETASFYPDSIGWENELKVFRDANIDKPAYYGFYIIKSSEQDNFSNLLFDDYTVRDDENVPVRSLKVFYLDKKEAIKRIEVVVKDENELFQSERYLLMNFDNRQGAPVLSSYQVSGNQKLKLNDSVSYEMKGRLIF